MGASDIYDSNAPLLIQNGYFPLPISPPGFTPAKAPVHFLPNCNRFYLFKGWSEQPSPLTSPQPGANIGVRCGNGLVAFDYDDDTAALRISEVFEPSPVNKAGQRAYTPIYRADFDVSSEDFYDADGNKVMQILSDGRQTVIPPSTHPDTHEPYRWTNGHSLYDTKLEDLPLLPRDYRERIISLGYQPRGKSKPKYTEKINPETGEIIVDDNFDSPHAELNAAALKNLDVWVPALNLHRCFRQRGRYPSYRAVATWRQSTVGKTLEERDTDLSIYGSGITDFGDGRGYTALDLVMAARSCGLSEAFCWLEEKLSPGKSDIEIDLDKIREAQEAPPIAPEADDTQSDDGAESDGKDTKPRRINPIPFVLPNERDVPRRQFLYGMHYMRGTVGGTIGTGGTGKSTLDLVEAIGMAVGRDLLGEEKLKKPLRVWYHNAEETLDELIRRITAICKYFKISQKDLGERLLITNGFETPIKVASGGRDVKIDGTLRKEIIDTIIELKIDVVIFDPLVAMHRVHEDFNIALDPVIRDAFGKIAHDTNCAIDLCHHTRKKPTGNDSEYTVADSRGGQSLIDAVRGARVLNSMSKTEAVRFDLEEDQRFDYMRLSRGKANMVRRGVIGWYKFETIDLDNGCDEEGIPGDIVAVLVNWAPPKDEDAVRPITLQDRTYWLGQLRACNTYRYDARAQDWFGYEIANRLGANLEDGKQRRVVTAILDDLIEEGTFAIEHRKDETRRMRAYVVPGLLADMPESN